MAALTWPPPCYSRPGGMRGPFLPYSGRVQVRASRSSHCLSGLPWLHPILLALDTLKLPG